jgi:aldehyde dehydrogenase (NAD+)
MRDFLKFYIDGQWVNPVIARTHDVINPATAALAGRVSLGGVEDVNRAVSAARKAFQSFSRTSREQRLALLQSVAAEFQRRSADMAAAITEEMGAPYSLSSTAHVGLGTAHLNTAIEVLKTYKFEEQKDSFLLAREPIGVCALITPWNWPVNQIVAKFAPALAVGCTMVMKPSEIAPFSGQVWTEICHSAGVPAGVFNLVNGDGATVGTALASHPDVDMVSFTGSTRAGIEVARNAAATVKRVHQELGGKSPNLVLADADLAKAVDDGIQAVMVNSGQSCNAPTRLLVPAAGMAVAKRAARASAERVTVGDPNGSAQIGPVVSETQWNKIQGLIRAGVAEGATLVAGGEGRPAGLDYGFYVKPTVFADVTNDMSIARQEIFGPVVVILGYQSEEEAIQIANDTPYGLSAYVQSGDLDHARVVGRRLNAGQVHLNGAGLDFMAPFGGYKQSGNGREWGDVAFGEFMEVKALLGSPAPKPAQAARAS